MSDFEHPDDPRLLALFEELDPLPASVARMRGTVHEKLEASRRSLVGEWIALLRVRPVLHTAYLVGATGVLLVTTPLGTLLGAILFPTAP